MTICLLAVSPSSKYFPFPGNYPSSDSSLWNLIHREWAPKSQSSSNVTCFRATLSTISKLEKQGRFTGNLDWEDKPDIVSRWMVGWFPLGQGHRGNKWEGWGNAWRAQAREDKQELKLPAHPGSLPLPGVWLHHRHGPLNYPCILHKKLPTFWQLLNSCGLHSERS